MRWVKTGRVFHAEGQYPWMMHHASEPTPDLIADDRLRIYFGPRDAQGLTRTAFIDVDPADPHRLLHVHDRPSLDLGALGAFDDSGAMPACVVNDGDEKYMFYIGWNAGVTVGYRNSIGLAVSHDGGLTFERVFDGPIVDRTQYEPFFTATPMVLVENGVWRMWYSSCRGFLRVDGRPEPLYHIKYAESDDGRHWRRPNHTCIPPAYAEEANARPWVIRDGDRYRLWFCHRGSRGYREDPAVSYRIGYAESSDGLEWDRMDERSGIDISPDGGFDSMMTAYPALYEHAGVRHLLYCGDGFGREGFGHAVEG